MSDKPINYKRIKEIMRQVRSREKLAWKFFQEADAKNAPLYKERQELEARVRQLEIENIQLRARNREIEDAFETIRSVPVPA